MSGTGPSMQASWSAWASRLHGAPDEPAYAAALDELRQIADEARAEGLKPPSPAALESAERILREVCTRSRLEIEVYPLKDGEVAIDTGKFKHSVVVICDSNGGARCMVNLDGRHRRAIYDSVDDLPDGFLCEALSALDPRGALDPVPIWPTQQEGSAVAYSATPRQESSLKGRRGSYSVSTWADPANRLCRSTRWAS